MRLRVPAGWMVVIRKVVEGLQVVLVIAGVLSLTLFAWLQFERLHYNTAYLQEFDRASAALRRDAASEQSQLLGSSSLPRTQLSPEPQSSLPSTDVSPEPLPVLARGENHVAMGDMRILGRLQVPRLGLEVAVLAGLDRRTLRRGAGWIPGTARPGEQGNVGIAAHRDTFFQPLREIHGGDRIELETLAGRQSYVVRSVYVVDPGVTAVLASSAQPTLTLVTCFPFDYAGPAPRRYIVQAVADGAAAPDLTRSHATPSP
jgi:sortase A